MRIKPNQLAAHLQAQALASIYLVTGDEPQQVLEAMDAVRRQAKTRGFTERETFLVGPGFDWQQLLATSQSLSLFAERRLLELHLPEPKPGNEGAKALAAFAATPPADVILLIQTGRLPAETTKARWFTALDKAGVVVQVWPLEGQALTAWLSSRMQAEGLRPDQEAVRLLAERVTGNLPAAVQEIEKLRLIQGAGPVDATAVLAAVTDSARYDVFDLTRTALLGEAKRVVQTLAGLQAEAVEPALINWALTREIRELAAVAAAVQRGETAQARLAKVAPQPRRKQLQQAWHRSDSARWPQLLQACARLDRIVKGQAPGNPWDELLHLGLEICGQAPVRGGPQAFATAGSFFLNSATVQQA